jgi:glycosyltransferase involved in cell wall biosynthesis
MCSAFYHRKNPKLIKEMVGLRRDLDFQLLGKGWKNYEHFDTLMKAPNFEYISHLDYGEYAKWYANLDIFWSPSILEGGPVPTIESMMAGIVPVVSDTGNARDLIDHGNNGYIFSIDGSAEKTAKLFDLALQNKNDIRASVVPEYGWEQYCQRYKKVMNITS